MVQALAVQVPEEVGRSWGEALEKWQRIAQAEIAPVLVALSIWRQLLFERDVVFYVDNTSAQ